MREEASSLFSEAERARKTAGKGARERHTERLEGKETPTSVINKELKERFVKIFAASSHLIVLLRKAIQVT